MKRKAAIFLAISLCCFTAAALAAEGGTAIPAVGITAAFPSGWTVVTPDTVDKHFKYFSEETPEIAAQLMRADGIHAAAFSSAGDAVLRVIAVPGGQAASQFYDIERYSAAMRSAIADSFLDKDAWTLTGYRYTEADWTNKEGQGRMLHLSYSVRYGEDIIARGKQAYTIRNGMEITLDLQVTGRQISTEDERAYNAFLADTSLPTSAEEAAPLLPVGLVFTATVPEETHVAKVTFRGETTKAALVSAWVIPEDGDAYNIGQIQAGGGGTFKLEIELPSEGEWRIYVKSELEGYAISEEAFWIDYDAKRLPVTFTEMPEGDVYDSQIYITGKTISGVTIQCMEGDKNYKKTTGSDGSFSFKLDRTIVGDRKVVLSFTKKNYDNRRFDVEFNRQWTREDYVKQLSSQVQSLSFANLTERAEKYIGRLVAYKGTVLDVSSAGERVYVQLGMKQDKEGKWTERIIAVADGMEVLVATGDSVTLYIEVTGEFYAFSDVTVDGDEVDIDLPSVKLLTYEKHV